MSDVRCGECSGMHDFLGMSHDESRRLESWTVAYYQLLAQTRPSRLWITPAWDWRPRIGSDERSRVVLSWGRLALALWWCRCEHCRDEVETLRLRVEQCP